MADCTSAMVTVPLESQSPAFVSAVLVAEQLAFVPPLLPIQLQLQGPVPVTAVAVPIVQKLVVGATVNVVPLLLPQAPFTGVLLQIRRGKTMLAVCTVG